MKSCVPERVRPATGRWYASAFLIRRFAVFSASPAKRLSLLQLVFAAATLLLTSLPAASAVFYRLTNLGISNLPASINDVGEVVGWGETPAGLGGFRWSAATGTLRLGALPGGSSSYPASINNAGQIVGESGSRIGQRAFRWTPSGGFQDLGGVPRHDSGATSNNNAGEAAGVAMNHAVRWTAAGAMQDLGTLSAIGNYSVAYGMNDADQVVGISAVDNAGGTHAFLWSASGGMQDLGVLPGRYTSSSAADINNQGQVVGVSGEQAFIWSSTDGMHDLGTFPGGQIGSRAVAINDAGQVVGSSTPPGGYYASAPFVWTRDAGMQNLNARVVPDDPLKAKIELVAATDINNAGQIVGWGTDGHGGNYGVLLTPTPIPEHADWAMLLAGLSLMGIVARWRPW